MRSRAEIQSICNGKLPPITMQGLERPTKKQPGQEQRETMQRTMKKNNGNADRSAITAEVVNCQGQGGRSLSVGRHRYRWYFAEWLRSGRSANAGFFCRHARTCEAQAGIHIFAAAPAKTWGWGPPSLAPQGTGAAKNSPRSERHFSSKSDHRQEQKANIHVIRARSASRGRMAPIADVIDLGRATAAGASGYASSMGARTLHRIRPTRRRRAGRQARGSSAIKT
jgi:hypothetical protein